MQIPLLPLFLSTSVLLSACVVSTLAFGRDNLLISAVQVQASDWSAVSMGIFQSFQLTETAAMCCIKVRLKIIFTLGMFFFPSWTACQKALTINCGTPGAISLQTIFNVP